MKSPKLILVAAALLVVSVGVGQIVNAQLPDPGMSVDVKRTALVITDPQNDFLSEDGVTWGVVGESVKANNTVANIESLLKLAKDGNIPVRSVVEIPIHFDLRQQG